MPNTMALIREVTQNFSNIMEEKLGKFTETFEKTTLENRSRRFAEAEQSVRLSD